MKNLCLNIFLVVAALFVSACEDFLEKHPLDELSSQTFWKNEKDADMALAGVYSRLLNNTYDINRIDWDAMTDDFFLFGTYGRVDNIAKWVGGTDHRRDRDQHLCRFLQGCYRLQYLS